MKKKHLKFKKKAEKQAAKLIKKAEKFEARGKDVGDLRDRASQLSQSAQDVRDMRNDETTEYRYGKLGGKESQRLGLVGPSTLNTGKNEKGNDVFTMFTENNIGNKLHETRHGGDLARGTLKYNTTGGYGVSHEISAYKAQYSWSGSLSYIPYTDFNNQTNLMRLLGGVENLKITITHINQINLGVVNSMVDNPGLGQILIYPPVIDRNGTRMSLSIWNNN